MKKITAAIIIFAMAISLVGCFGGREIMDLSSASSLADLKGAKLAAQAGSFHVQAMDQIEDVDANTYPKFDDLIVAVRSGAIDGCVVEEPSALSVCQKDDTLDYVHLVNNSTGFTATASEVGIAIGVKKGSDLRDKMDAVLANVTTEQRMKLMEEIISLRNGGKVEKFSVSSDKTDTSNGTLKVAMECTYEPFNWTETTDKMLGSYPISSEGNKGLYCNGYDVQIARYVASELGMKLEIYAVEWDSIIAAVQAGTVDAIVAGMSPTEDRKRELDFTETYYESNLVIIYKKTK